MKPNLILLEARIKKELLQLYRLEDELKVLVRTREPKLESFKLRAYASILHDFYSGIEKILISIAREIDNTVPRSEGWHRQLLEQMTLELPSRRPAVIGTKLSEKLKQYLSFRHRFRNLYGFELEWARMEELIKEMGTTLKEFAKSIDDFIEEFYCITKD